MSLALSGSAVATSLNKVDDMANLKLAMLTLSEKTFYSKSTKMRLLEKASLRKTSLKKSKNKSSKVIKTPVFDYPSNCLKWTATQINRKALTHLKSISKYSRLNRVDGNLIKSIITAESCFRTKALSNKGARGLMQLIPATAERFGVDNIYSPDQNIKGGSKYLKFLLDRYKGNLKKTIAAYNAGEGAVDRYKGVPPYRETKNYVKNVLMIYQMLTPKKVIKKVVNKKITRPKKRVRAVYQPPKLGSKPGRHGWQYNKRLAPHLYKH